MVFDTRKTDPARYKALKQLQRWTVTGLYRAVPFENYDSSIRRQDKDAPENLELALE